MDRRTTTGNELTIVGWEDSKSVCDCMLHQIVILVNSCQLYKDGIKISRLKLQFHNHFPLTSTTREWME